MNETVETIKDVEKSLADARARLLAFENGVDRARLLKRLKLASPAHPVLLFRFMFALLTLTAVAAIVAVLVVPVVNADLARTLAKFDAIVPSPPGVPGLPALLGLLAICMVVGYAMTTMAALAMGRDAQMLPWEQKQHQKLVNEVTRLTTQKAVMERMRSTPAGARPRMETPVPVSLRERSGMQTPSALGRLGESHPGSPPRLGGVQPGRFGAAPDGSGAGGTSNPFGRAPGSAVPAVSRASASPTSPAAGAMFGAPTATPPGAPTAGTFSAPAGGGGGVLARARSGALKTTPAGAAGRLTPTFNRPGAATSVEEEGSDDSNPFGGSGGSLGASAGGGNPFATPGGAPGTPNPFGGGAQPRPSNPFGGGSSPFGGGGSRFGSGAPAASEPGGVFGTPPDVGVPSPSLSAGPRLGPGSSAAPDLPDIVDSSPSYSYEAGVGRDEPDETDAHQRRVSLPRWGGIDDPWLEEAVERVEALAHRLPQQAHLSFSEETHLPFTLVIARAAPTVAVKALVSYVEFLSTIPTPPRARIDLNASPGLDRSFHRNVEAALQPIYGDDFEVDLEPGRVEVTFKRPDPAWEDYPVMPIE